MNRRRDGRMIALGLLALVAFATACTTADGANDDRGRESVTSEADESAGTTVDCSAEPTPISPHIYGTGFRARDDATNAQWTLGTTGRRWGGNPTSRYNWAGAGWWNTASDYFFRNINVLPERNERAHEAYLADNWAHGVESAVTVPMLGWVSKDGESYTYSVADLGEQEQTDPYLPDAGNGLTPGGETIEPPDPERTSVTSDTASIAAWVTSMVEFADQRGESAPFMYFLDNEPELWHDTHRDVRTTPIGYDELLKTSIDYATAVREADPSALIAGPSPWGWPAYTYSALDAEDGFGSTPDFDSHDSEPIIEWYLSAMREEEERTGVRLLDVLDVHFYPQTGVYFGGNDADTAALRIRSTRALWDPTYRDESWIDEKVELIPRMQRWVDDNYPGTKLSIGEYSFGGEDDMSGALAQAESLGQFGRLGLFAAYYWTVPPIQSPVYWAFRAFRDYDGAGAEFGDLSIPVTGDSATVSLFASRSSADDSITLVALNTDPGAVASLDVALTGCAASGATTYVFTGAAAGFQPGAPTVAGIAGQSLELELPAYSITVIELVP